MNNITKAVAFEVRLKAGYEQKLEQSTHLFEDIDWLMLENNLSSLSIKFVLMEVEMDGQPAQVHLVATNHCESIGCFQAAAADEGQMTVQGQLMRAEQYLAWYQRVIANPVLIDQDQMAGISYRLYRHKRSLPPVAKSELEKFGAAFVAHPDDSYPNAPDRIEETYSAAKVPAEVLAAITYGSSASRFDTLPACLKANDCHRFALDGLTSIDALIAGMPAPLGAQADLF